MAKAEAEEEKITEEEEEVKTEEETTLQPRMEEASIRNRIKPQANIKHIDKGIINPKSNVITVRSMVIMKMNVGRNRMT